MQLRVDIAPGLYLLQTFKILHITQKILILRYRSYFDKCENAVSSLANDLILCDC